MRRIGWGDLGLAILLLGVSGAIWSQTGGLRRSRFDPLGAAAVPRALCLILAGLAAMLMLGALAPAVMRARPAAGQDTSAQPDHRQRPGLALAAMAVTSAYVAALDMLAVPFVWATLGYLLVLGAMLAPQSRRGLAAAAIVAVIGAPAVDLLFRVVLAVDLR